MIGIVRGRNAENEMAPYSAYEMICKPSAEYSLIQNLTSPQNFTISSVHNLFTCRFFLSFCLSICLSVRPSIHPSIHPSIYPSIHPSIYLSIYQHSLLFNGK